MLASYSNWFTLYELEEDSLNLDFDLEHAPLTCFAFPQIASIGSSANGLLFLFDFDRGDNYFYVCNPITREFIELRCGKADMFGFGASKVGKKHKVVYINPRSAGEDNPLECYVYTIGTGSWRLVEAADSFDRSPTGVAAFAHGNLHWMVSSHPDWMDRVSCFDLETERFSSFAVPPLGGYQVHRSLYALRDSLAFCDGWSDGCAVDVWMMKEYGVGESWAKEYVIWLHPFPGGGKFQRFDLIKAYENGDLLLLFETTFFYYSKERESCGEIGGLFGAGQDLDCEHMFLSSMLYTPSMVSLKKCFGSVENVISF